MRKKERYKDNIQADLNCHIDINTWENMATNKVNWRKFVHGGAALYNIHFHHAAEDKCRTRKSCHQKAPTHYHHHSPLPTLQQSIL